MDLLASLSLSLSWKGMKVGPHQKAHEVEGRDGEGQGAKHPGAEDKPRVKPPRNEEKNRGKRNGLLRRNRINEEGGAKRS